MSFSVSLTSFNPSSLPELPQRPVEPVPQPTSTQRMHLLEASGETLPQIASNLGLPVATVDSTLGYTISSASQSSVQASIRTAGRTALAAPRSFDA